MSLLDGFFSLSQHVNTVTGEEEVKSKFDLLPELTLSMDDDELLRLARLWEKTWKASQVFKETFEKQKENEKYWKGDHFQDFGENRPVADNILFEATETFLPMITRSNPEPIVDSDNTDEGNQLANDVQRMLAFQADRLRFKMRLQDVARYWALYFIGVGKVGWDKMEDDITFKAIRPQKMIFDPDGTVDGCVFDGEYVGEYRQEKAYNLVTRFPKKEKEITDHVKGKMGTTVSYIEWWTDDYVFWELTGANIVLSKAKNPHWNYSTEVEKVDEFGTAYKTQEQGINHFAHAKKPYIFLSVYNLGTSPYDSTNIIQQNIANQELINKRLRQIDKNADKTNNSEIFSGDAFTKEQSAEASKALRKGDPIWVPTGDVRGAVDRVVPPPLPNYVYESLLDYRSELRNIFGVRGSSAQGVSEEKTVRGKVIIKGADSDRMSLITEHIEQFSDEVFNWFVQLFAVYYTEEHAAAVIGNEKSKEMVRIKSSDLNRKLTVGVQEGSMLPKDSVTKHNQAVDLLTAGLLDPITAFEMMDFPNPRETAFKLYQWKSNPAALFGEVPSMQVPQESATIPPQGQQISLDPNTLNNPIQ